MSCAFCRRHYLNLSHRFTRVGYLFSYVCLGLSLWSVQGMTATSLLSCPVTQMEYFFVSEVTMWEQIWYGRKCDPLKLRRIPDIYSTFSHCKNKLIRAVCSTTYIMWWWRFPDSLMYLLATNVAQMYQSSSVTR